jgi:hypothetical protein
MRGIIRQIVLFLCLAGLSINANAFTATFNFIGECDDCAFNGDPTDEGFNPIGDGLTETVTGKLIIDGLSINSETGMIQNLGEGTVIFQYDGSSLINPFTMGSPYLFTSGLMPNGDIADGFVFTIGSTLNLADPSNPEEFNFPDFYTELGLQLLGFGCNEEDVCFEPFIGDIRFTLDSEGNWEITGLMASDIGISGYFSPAPVPLPGALILFGSGIFGLIGVIRRRRRS